MLANCIFYLDLNLKLKRNLRLILLTKFTIMFVNFCSILFTVAFAFTRCEWALRADISISQPKQTTPVKANSTVEPKAKKLHY